MKEYSSIFNHALAPITPGPSSSNTCGPVRIGMVCQQLLGEVPAKAVVEYYTKGAFPNTLYGMKSDVAFVNGLLGLEQNTPGFNDAYQKARDAGMDVSFAEVDDLTVGGMETVRVRMTAHDGFRLTVIGESVGGGAFRIHYIDDCPMDIRGMNYELLVFLNAPSGGAASALVRELAAQVEKCNDAACVTGGSYSIVNVKTAVPVDPALLAALTAREDVARVRVVKPIHPIITDVSRKPPFESAEEMVAYCRSRQCSPARAAIDYEAAVSGWSEERIRSYGDMLIAIMRDSRAGGFRPDLRFDGIVSAKAALLQNRVGREGMPSLGLLDDAIPSALGIMEHSNATGKIVCVPTGGSSGIVPGLLLSAAERMHASDDALYEALMTAGIAGVLMMVDGNEFAGGTHGCQAEIACGTAMAAAGLVRETAAGPADGRHRPGGLRRRLHGAPVLPRPDLRPRGRPGAGPLPGPEHRRRLCGRGLGGGRPGRLRRGDPPGRNEPHHGPGGHGHHPGAGHVLQRLLPDPHRRAADPRAGGGPEAPNALTRRKI